jgi:hypothetical protein
VLLKGNGVADVLSETWPLVAFMTVVMLIGLRASRARSIDRAGPSPESARRFAVTLRRS